MKKTDDLPYLEKKDTTKEMIYGGGETISEIKQKSKDVELLTE